MRGFGSTYQRGKIWWVSFWRQGKQTRESVGSEKEKDAVELLKRRFAEAHNQQPASALSLTVRHLYGALELDYVINHRKSLRNVRQVWENHLKAPFANVLAHLLTPEEITEYIAARQKEKAENGTINRELAALKRMYKLALRTRRLTIMPYIPMLKESNVRRGFVKDPQYAALARETGKIGLWLRTLFEVAYCYGWRRGELLKMKVRQLDFIERTIDLDPGSTKNDESRKVQMMDAVFVLMHQCVAGKAPEDFVFTRDHESNGRKTKTKGGKIADFRKDWEKATAAAGCPDLLFHDLRRTGARNLRRAGVPEGVIMEIGGWKTRSVFERYNIVDESDKEAAVHKLEKAAKDRRLEDLQQEMFREEKKPPHGTGAEPGKERKIQ